MSKQKRACVVWLSDEISNEANASNFFCYYRKFHFNNIIGSIGDVMLIHAAEPDADSCYVAQILELYEDLFNKNEPFRAKVQWFSRPEDLPKACLDGNNDLHFYQREVIQDHRPFCSDIAIETIYRRCEIFFTVTKDHYVLPSSPYQYICRYRLIPTGRKKCTIEPVMEQERNKLLLLNTHTRPILSTPKILSVRLSRIPSTEIKLSESKMDGRKIVKKKILADKNIKDHATTSVSESTPRITNRKRSNTSNVEDIPSTSKQRSPHTQQKEYSIAPKDIFNFDNMKRELYKTRYGRLTLLTKFETEEQMDTSDEEFKRARIVTNSKISTTPKAGKIPTPKLPIRLSVDNMNECLHYTESLPGREKQIDNILTFVKNKFLFFNSGCMYISGEPGSGKTAAVNAAVKVLKEAPDMPEFQLVQVNGMKLPEPRRAYVQIYEQLTGETVAWKQARNLLEKRFTSPGPRSNLTVLFVDEIDALQNRGEDVVCSIAEWATHDIALLTVLAVANTTDFPDKALPARLLSRLDLTRLNFPTYTNTQLECIVASKFKGANVTPDAVQLIARKVASVSGDARQALALCSRALALAEPRTAGLEDVERVLQEARSSDTVRAIRNAAPAERLMLRAIASEVDRTGSNEITLARALQAARSLVALEGRRKSATSIGLHSLAQAQAICARLASMSLLLMDLTPTGPKLILNVNPIEVYYASK